MEPLMASVSLQKSGRQLSLSLHVRTQQESVRLQAQGGHHWARNSQLEAGSDRQLAESSVHQELNLSAPLIWGSPTLAVRTQCLIEAAPTVVLSGDNSCWFRGPPRIFLTH